MGCRLAALIWCAKDADAVTTQGDVTAAEVARRCTLTVSGSM